LAKVWNFFQATSLGNVHLDLHKQLLYGEKGLYHIDRLFYCLKFVAAHKIQICPEIFHENLNENSPQLRLSRGNLKPWTPQSRLHSTRLLLTGLHKQQVSRVKINDMDHLKRRIKDAAETVTPYILSWVRCGKKWNNKQTHAKQLNSN
jgi:hypothetical protein